MGDADQTLLMSLDTPLVWLKAKSSFTVVAIAPVTLGIRFVHSSYRHSAWRSLVLGGVASQSERPPAQDSSPFNSRSGALDKADIEAADFLFSHMFYLSKPNLIVLGIKVLIIVPETVTIQVHLTTSGIMRRMESDW